MSTISSATLQTTITIAAMNSEKPLYMLYAWVIIQGGLILLKLIGVSKLSWLYTISPTIIPIIGVIAWLIIGVIGVLIISLTAGKDR